MSWGTITTTAENMPATAAVASSRAGRSRLRFVGRRGGSSPRWGRRAVGIGSTGAGSCWRRVLRLAGLAWEDGMPGAVAASSMACRATVASLALSMRPVAFLGRSAS